MRSGDDRAASSTCAISERVPKDRFHPIEHRVERITRSHERVRPHRLRGREHGVREQPVDAGRKCAGVLFRDDRRRVAVSGDFGDRARIGGDAGNAREHRLQQRLRNALVGVRRQRDHVDRREPGRDIALLAGECHLARQAERGDLPLQRIALRSVADDDEMRIAVRKARQRVDQEAVALPAPQRRDDADQRDARGQSEPASRIDLHDSHVMRWVDAGRHRHDALRVEPVVANQLLAQRIAGRHGPRGRPLVEPARGRVVRNGYRHVPRAHEDRCAGADDPASERGEPAVGRAVRVHDVRGGVAQRPVSAETRRALATDRQRSYRHIEARRFVDDARSVRSNNRHVMAATAEACRFGQDADFLPAPAHRRLGVDDRQRPGRRSFGNRGRPPGSPC